MSTKTVVTCDNCGREEPITTHARELVVKMKYGSVDTDEGMSDIGIKVTSDICGFCASRVRQALIEARP